MEHLKISCLLLTLSSLIFGQTPAVPLAFDVASVKLAQRPADGRFISTIRNTPGGLNYENVDLRTCLMLAYHLQRFQITGPAWISTQRYVIVAKASGPVSDDRRMLMLQSLLSERFKLVLKREQRLLDTYDLVIAKNGPKLQPAREDGRFAIQTLPSGPGEEDTKLAFSHNSMSDLADFLTKSSSALNRPVLNKTGIEGFFDFRIVYALHSNPESIFDALPRQIGLKLDSTKESIDILRVESGESVPTEN